MVHPGILIRGYVTYHAVKVRFMEVKLGFRCCPSQRCAAPFDNAYLSVKR